jgi:predicted RNA binding protein YcfA (HicA-like mRNA interferase family)
MLTEKGGRRRRRFRAAEDLEPGSSACDDQGGDSTRSDRAPSTSRRIRSADLTPIPRKVRDLIADLERARFIDRSGKGSHRNFEHPEGIRVTISGKTGDDAKPYQEKEVRKAIEEAES